MEGAPRPRPPAIQLQEAEEMEFEVDCLLDRRVSRGRTEYLVRWRGYTAFDDTWEPASNLANA